MWKKEIEYNMYKETGFCRQFHYSAMRGKTELLTQSLTGMRRLINSLYRNFDFA
jgi:hypothetical protein